VPDLEQTLGAALRLCRWVRHRSTSAPAPFGRTGGSAADDRQPAEECV